MRRFYKLFITLLLTANSFSAVAQTISETTSDYPQLTNIPTLYVNTVTGSDPKDKENYINCTVRLVDGDQTTTYVLDEANYKSGIRGRGNSTWSAAKKPWRLKFNKKVKFLGSDFANAKSWTLLANTYDKSLMRNALTYYLGTFIGMDFSPSAQFVELVMNGDYRGVYQISDQMEVRKKRVDISEDYGWLLEYGNDESKVDDPKVSINYDGTYYGQVQIKNPEFTDDKLSSNQPLADNIDDYLNNKFMPLFGESEQTKLIDPRNGYRSIVNEKALIDYYIATEITTNWDAFYSIYMFRDPSSKTDTLLHLGPLWDEDLAYGNSTETYSTYYFPEADFYQKLLLENNTYNKRGSYRKMQPIMANVLNDPWFVIAIKRRFDELVKAGISSHLQSKVKEMKSLLTTAAASNFKKWDIDNVDTQNNHKGFKWENYVNELESFVISRVSTVNRLLTEKAANIAWLSENEDYSVSSEATVEGVVVEKPFVKDTWQALCLPFSLSESDIVYYFGSGSRVAEFTSTTTQTDGTIALTFSDVSATEAGKPYLVLPALAVNVPFTFLNRTLSADETQSVEHDGVKFVGSYSPFDITAGDETKHLIGTDKKLYTPSETVKVAGLSAYFDIPASKTGTKQLVFANDVSGINAISVSEEQDSRVFNLNGQQVGTTATKLPKGVYIVGKKKVVVK